MLNLILFVALFLAAFLGIARTKTNPLLVLVALAGVFFLFGLLDWLDFIWTGAGIILSASVSALFLFSQVRQPWVSSRLFKSLKKTLPPISATEQIAINAGTVGWEKSIFTGEANWERLNQIPTYQLSEAEQRFLEEEVEQLCAMCEGHAIQKRADLSKKAWHFIKEKRFFGMIIPPEYGGLGFSATAHARVIAKLASRNSALGVTVMVPNSLGPGELLLHYGTEAQKKQYLPRLASGEEIPCFALTSSVAGSDAGSIEDRGMLEEREVDGQMVLGVRLDWNKRYITLAPVATLLGLAFKAFDADGLLEKYYPEHPLAGKNELGITCALISTNAKGVHIGSRHNPLWTPFMNGPTRGESVWIPMNALIGEEQYIGQGWRMLIESLGVGRCISLPALSVAGTQLCYYTSSAYCGARVQFKVPIGYFEGIQEPLAQMAVNAYANKAFSEMATDALDDGQKPAVLAAMIKYASTNALRTSVNHAMDVHGGRAIMAGDSNYLEALYRSVPISITVEGANILTRSMMVFGQGAMRCHPYLIEELEALNDENHASGEECFDGLLQKHVQYHIRLLAKSISGSISKGALLSCDAPTVIKRPWQQLNHLSAQLGWLADVGLMLLGGDLKRREGLSARFADAWMHLVIASVTMRKWNQDGYPAQHKALVLNTCQTHFCQAEDALISVVNNLPVARPLRIAIKLLSFPLGKRYAPVALKQWFEIAKQGLTPSRLGLELHTDIYIGQHDDAISILIRGFDQQQVCADWQKKMAQHGHKKPDHLHFEEWLGELVTADILNKADKKQWLDAHQAVQRAMAVDDFAKL